MVPASHAEQAHHAASQLVIPTSTAQDVLDHFLRGKTQDTLRAYRRDLEAFARWLKVADATAAVGVLLSGGAGAANRLVLGWITTMQERKLSTATQRRRLYAVRSLVHLARLLGVIEWQIDVRAPKHVPYRDTAGPTAETMRLLLSACDAETTLGRRNRLLVLVTVVLGLRRSEAVKLRRRNYDRERRRLRVLGKGGTDTWLTLPAIVASELNSWLEELPPGDDTPLFPGSNPLKPMTGGNFYAILKRLGDQVGVKVHPHGLRHTAITVGLQKGHSVPQVQKLSRHVDPGTVMIYDDNVRDEGAAVSQSIADEVLGSDSSDLDED